MTETQPVPEFLQNKNLRLILFGGKGGVGKTTMAAAAALHLARSRGQDKRVLVISTDPAHSLADSFGIRIGDRVTRIEWSVGNGQWVVVSGQGAEVRSPDSNDQCLMTNLFARELNAARLLDEFREKNQEVITKLAERGTYFDEEDIAGFLNLSLPGMDEVMAIIEMARLLKAGVYDVLVVDTAPTGHTLRMLALPRQMTQWIRVLDLMQHKHRYMATQFSGRTYVDDACDRFLKSFSSDIQGVLNLLTNEETTRFVPALTPESMVVHETERLNQRLTELSIPVKAMVVNRVARDEGCSVCRARKSAQKPVIDRINTIFLNHDLIQVPLLAREVQGIERLQGLADCLGGGPVPVTAPGTVKDARRPERRLHLNPSLEFCLFGGKGGVGKTTLAASTAIYLARANPEKKVLLFSTDPAHSLSDALDQPIGDRVTPIEWSGVSGQGSGVSLRPGGAYAPEGGQPPARRDLNLFALEIDGDRLFAEYKATFEQEINGVFDRFLSSGVDVKFDREVMTELFSLAPPGLDEIMALDRIMDLHAEAAFDTFVLDTAPTGHLLRFLALPALVREWLNAFFRLLIKYKGVVRLTKIAEKALALSRNVRRIQKTLTDPQKSECVAVTIAEVMGFSELKRLMGALHDAGISCTNIAVNQVTPPSSCSFCRARRDMEQTQIDEIIQAFPDANVVEVPLFERGEQGVAALEQVGCRLLADSSMMVS